MSVHKRTELKTLELWILRLMLDHLFLLPSRLIFFLYPKKVYKIQPIEWRMQLPEQQIISREIKILRAI